MHKRPAYLNSVLPCLLTALLASGCGGSSDNDDSAPPPAPPTPPVAFGVTATVPAATTSVSAARDAGFSAIFSSAVDAASVDAASAQLLGPEGNLIPSTAAVSGSTVKLTPQTGSLPGGTGYTVKLSTAIKSTAGQALPAAFSAVLHTAAQQWDREIVRVDTGTSLGSGGPPLLAVAPDGAATLIWKRMGVFNSDSVWFSRLAPGGSGLSAPAGVPVTGTSLEGLNALAAPNGNVHLGYFNYTPMRPGYGQGHVATFDAATGAWTNRTLSGNEQTYAPTLSVDQNNNVTAVLRGAANGALYISRLPAGASAWTPLKVAFAPSAGGIDNYAQALDKDGNLHLAWRQSGSAAGLFSSRYDAAADTWSAPVLVDANASGAAGAAVRLVIDETGGATLAWLSHPGGDAGQQVVAAARRPAASTQWSAVQQLSDPAVAPADPPLLAVSPAGAATLLYRKSNEWFAVRSAPGAQTFDRANAKLVLAQSLDANAPTLTVDRAGNLNLLFYSLTNAMTSHVRYWAVSGTWDLTTATRPIGTGPSGQPVRSNVFAQEVMPNGDVLAIWLAALSSDVSTGNYMGATRYR